MNSGRRRLIAALGGGAALTGMTTFQKAEALERELMVSLAQPSLPEHVDTLSSTAPSAERPRLLRAGVGRLFGNGRDPVAPLTPLPARPTLVDFFQSRFDSQAQHCLQSATRAMKNGDSEEVVLACLLHDLAQCLMVVDHGWWGAQLLEPYVSKKVSWAIRYHQALRFFPDESVGYEYPQLYVKKFGPNYTPDPWIRDAHEYARRHKWYMTSRMITVHDDYSFDRNVKLTIDPFVDIIGRRFRQPKEGLGFDGSPVAHMWRSLNFPDHLL